MLITLFLNQFKTVSKACIIDFPFLLEEDDKYGGTTPYRMYNGMRYKGGYSDHLPVLLELEVYP